MKEICVRALSRQADISVQSASRKSVEQSCVTAVVPTHIVIVRLPIANNYRDNIPKNKSRKAAAAILTRIIRLRRPRWQPNQDTRFPPCTTTTRQQSCIVGTRTKRGMATTRGPIQRPRFNNKPKERIKNCEAKPMKTSIDDLRVELKGRLLPPRICIFEVENEQNELIPTRLVTGWRSKHLNTESWNKGHQTGPFSSTIHGPNAQEISRERILLFSRWFLGLLSKYHRPQMIRKETFTCPSELCLSAACLWPPEMHQAHSRDVWMGNLPTT
ncbi:hypothetical protein Tco_1354757 [Tanacetum coccineum]